MFAFVVSQWVRSREHVCQTNIVWLSFASGARASCLQLHVALSTTSSGFQASAPAGYVPPPNGINTGIWARVNFEHRFGKQYFRAPTAGDTYSWCSKDNVILSIPKANEIDALEIWL
jgi:hypothetical protein